MLRVDRGDRYLFAYKYVGVAARARRRWPCQGNNIAALTRSHHQWGDLRCASTKRKILI
jgi:hypothetical protein